MSDINEQLEAAMGEEITTDEPSAVAECCDDMRECCTSMCGVAENFVRRAPLTSVLIAAGVGFVAGWLVRRR